MAIHYRIAANRGVTLIELAVVIALLAILAAVAFPRFDQVALGAEQAVITDFVQKLYACRAARTINTAQLSNDFHDFVTTGQYAASDDHTITLSNVAKGTCRIASNTQIACPTDNFPALFKQTGKSLIITLNGETISANLP